MQVAIISSKNNEVEVLVFTITEVFIKLARLLYFVMCIL